MSLRSLSFQICAASALLAQAPTFSAAQAIQAEWSRKAPVFTEAERAALKAADRARLDLTIRRIGAPGAPALLPPELEKPTVEAWEAKARVARTPAERFDALYYLNRMKSPKALQALEGLTPADAKTWPRHLHLEAQLASARLLGCEPSADLQAFLEALRKAGKTDPVRAQAARFRLVAAGKEQALLPPIPATSGSILALLDAWNRQPWAKRQDLALGAFQALSPQSPAWAALGLAQPTPRVLETACTGILARLAEGLPTPAPQALFEKNGTPWSCAEDPLATWYALQSLPRFETIPDGVLDGLIRDTQGAVLQGNLLPVLRKHRPAAADALRERLLVGADPVARSAALDDFQEAPKDLDGLLTRLWKVEEFDGVQVLLNALDRWKVTPEARRPLLTRLLQHPCWTARLDAWTQLAKLDPATPWPEAPAPSALDRALLEEATRLATAGKPVRLRLTFSGRRQVTLRLDPVNAPLNVANLVRLVRQGFYNGRRVPRVVPDFVVQMGSPSDTMDGGPGYTVRCENSLTWFGPGSVGMALSGKDTGGSQFFLTTNATPHLTGRYTRVGAVEDLDRALPLLDALELGARLEKAEVIR